MVQWNSMDIIPVNILCYGKKKYCGTNNGVYGVFFFGMFGSVVNVMKEKEWGYVMYM